MTSDPLSERRTSVVALIALRPNVATPATLRRRGLRVLQLPFRRALIYTPPKHWSNYL